MGCTRSACSKRCFSIAQNTPDGRSERRPAADAQPGSFKENTAIIDAEEPFQSGGLVSSTSEAVATHSLTSSSRYFLRAASSAKRSSARRREASSPVKVTVTLPSRSPLSVSLNSPLRRLRDLELSGSTVITHDPPSLSTLYPFTPVSLHGSMPNVIKGDPGSRYKSFPLSFTRTTSLFRRLTFIVSLSKK